MKTILKSISIALVASFLLGSCEEVKEIIPLPSMTATVDGEAWTSIFRATVLFQNNNMLTINGTPEATKDVDKAISIEVFGTEAGTYELALGSLSGDCAVIYKKVANAEDGGDNYFVAYQATVTITKIDKDKQQVSGTFSAKLRSTGNLVEEVIISNGVFENLNYKLED